MSRYLRQKGTGRIYAYSPQIATRDDMEVWSGPTKKDKPKTNKPNTPKPNANKDVGNGKGKNDPNPGNNDVGEGHDPETIIIGGKAVPMSEASPVDLSAYIEKNFGEKIPADTDRKILESQLRAQIGLRGHPDIEE